MADYPEDTRHVSPDERADAVNPDVGDGTPDTAPELLPSNDDWQGFSFKPTRKWVVGLAGAVSSILASWIVTGAFDDVERGMVGASLATLVPAYWTRNSPTPGGVPEKP